MVKRCIVSDMFQMNYSVNVACWYSSLTKDKLHLKNTSNGYIRLQ